MPSHLAQTQSQSEAHTGGSAAACPPAQIQLRAELAGKEASRAKCHPLVDRRERPVPASKPQDPGQCWVQAEKDPGTDGASPQPRSESAPRQTKTCRALQNV